MSRVALVAALAFLIGCGEDRAAPSPAPLATPPAELPRLGQAPDFRLVDQDGRPSGRAELAGRVWIADFVFTNCAGICWTMTAAMRQLQDQLSGVEGLRFVSVSVDPERDTPERLTWYAGKHGADPARWRFLTGERDAIRRLSHEGFHLAIGEPADGDIPHSSRFVLVDREGEIRGYYDGTDGAEIDRLAADARRLGAP